MSSVKNHRRNDDLCLIIMSTLATNISMKKNTNFYKNIIRHKIQLKELLKNEEYFSTIPNNWFIIVTDIENSSKAVELGKHNDVNLTATGSIITVLNELKKINPKLKIPYFFGGDGATFIIPPTIKDRLLSVLQDYSIHIKNTLKLNLRVGSIEVSEVYKNNYTLRISKLRHNSLLTTPVILGNGLKFAESKIKATYKSSATDLAPNITIDLQGMECRWDEVFPSDDKKRIGCVLISAINEKEQAFIFSKIITKIDSIFGDLNQRNPITTTRLKLLPTLEKIRKEMYTRIGVFNRSYLVTNWLITLFGVYYFKLFKAGKLYLQQVTQLSDTIMLDGAINTVISGDVKQFQKFIAFLDNLESQHKIIYGLHQTYASVMTCYIQNNEKKHIHFVDGTEGGYTTASIIYKEKLKKQYTFNQ